ncbi:glycosyltransferase [Chondrinema litorale]|uniref:glycosyltransferase n=1 Tax=Chondrinema litorale TaxID=2994555 RepID=UPI002543D70B|nr:glycosyltransferase [Chondrinema litorale]UZS00183.1 glycosyltransferase [Chondrinema litorale]
MMKNLYYLSCSPIPSQKANSIQVMKMCQAFSMHCKEVILFCILKNHKEDLHKYYGVKKSFQVKAIKLPGIKFLNRIIYALLVFRKLKRMKAKGILYSRDIFSTGTICLLNPKNFSIIFEAHAPPATKLRKEVLRYIFGSKYFKGVVTISGALKEEYIRLYGDLIRDKTLIAHDGADGNQIPSEMIENSNYNSKGTKLKLGYIGSLYPGKGSEIIIELAKLLPKYDFHIVGGTEEQINKLKEENTLDNVCFHGFVKPEQIYNYMDTFDIMLAPYKANVIVGSGTLDISKWMSPLKLFEYMGGGKAIIASDLPVLREVITNNETALLADPENLKDWESQIKHLELQENREKLGRNAQRLFFEHYTWDKRTAFILEHFFKKNPKLNDKLYT